MARPPKPDALKMSDDLRIPLTTSQKETIRQAAEKLGSDMTAWARPILLAQAEKVLAGSKKRNRK